MQERKTQLRLAPHRFAFFLLTIVQMGCQTLMQHHHEPEVSPIQGQVTTGGQYFATSELPLPPEGLSLGVAARHALSTSLLDIDRAELDTAFISIERATVRILMPLLLVQATDAKSIRLVPADRVDVIPVADSGLVQSMDDPPTDRDRMFDSSQPTNVIRNRVAGFTENLGRHRASLESELQKDSPDQVKINRLRDQISLFAEAIAFNQELLSRRASESVMYTVKGFVEKPGTYKKDFINIDQALASSGSLTLRGKDVAEIIVLTRRHGNKVHQYILPFASSIAGEQLSGRVTQMATKLRSAPLQDGDVLEFTRLSLIPMVARGKAIEQITHAYSTATIPPAAGPTGLFPARAFDRAAMRPEPTGFQKSWRRVQMTLPTTWPFRSSARPLSTPLDTAGLRLHHLPGR